MATDKKERLETTAGFVWTIVLCAGAWLAAHYVHAHFVQKDTLCQVGGALVQGESVRAQAGCGVADWLTQVSTIVQWGAVAFAALCVAAVVVISLSRGNPETADSEPPAPEPELASPTGSGVANSPSALGGTGQTSQSGTTVHRTGRRRWVVLALIGAAVVTGVGWFALRDSGPSCFDCTGAGFVAQPERIDLPAGIPDLSGLAGLPLDGVDCAFEASDPSALGGNPIDPSYARFDCSAGASYGVVNAGAPSGSIQCGDVHWPCYPNQGLHCQAPTKDDNEWLCEDSTTTLRIGAYASTQNEAVARVKAAAEIVAAHS